jgi:hypothetical protein
LESKVLSRSKRGQAIAGSLLPHGGGGCSAKGPRSGRAVIVEGDKAKPSLSRQEGLLK